MGLLIESRISWSCTQLIDTAAMHSYSNRDFGWSSLWPFFEDFFCTATHVGKCEDRCIWHAAKTCDNHCHPQQLSNSLDPGQSEVTLHLCETDNNNNIII